MDGNSPSNAIIGIAGIPRVALSPCDLPGYPAMTVAVPPGTAYKVSVGNPGAPMFTRFVSAIDCPAEPAETGGSGVALRLVIPSGETFR